MYSKILMTSQDDIARDLAPLLYVLNKLGKTGKHETFKILYFADKAHIAAFGRTFTQDVYIAMANGPVPSNLFDYIRILEGVSKIPVTDEFRNELSTYFGIVPPYFIVPLKSADERFLSRSAIKYLDQSIATYAGKSFDELTNLSHDKAWFVAAEGSDKMSILEIAKDAGVNEEMIKYIQETK